MSTTQQSETDRDEIVNRFIDEFDAVEGYDMVKDDFHHDDVWVSDDGIVALVPHDVESFVVDPIEDTEKADWIELDDDELDIVTLLTVARGDDYHHYDNKYISRVLDVMDEDFEYLESNIQSMFGDYGGHVLFIEYENWFFVVEPRIIQ